MKISVVIPCFNEEKSIEELAVAICSVLDEAGYEYEIIFIDDGSTDTTFESCRRVKDKYKEKIKGFRFVRNYGKSAALSYGIAKSNGDIIITMDADLQDDPVAIPKMVDMITSGFDLVSGWKKKRNDPLSKTFPSKVWNTAIGLLSGLHIHDFNCGLKAYKASVAKNLEIYGERHRYLPLLAYWDGARVGELVVPHHPRRYGTSKYGVMRFFNGFFDVLTLIFLRRYLRNPLHFFGLLGLFFCVCGCSILTYFGIEWLISGQMRIRPLVLLSVGAIIMGIQFFSIGLLGELITQINPHRDYGIREYFE